MKKIQYQLSALLLFILASAMLLHGEIPQLAHYHEFADRRTLFGIANFADVLSNFGFALCSLWGVLRLGSDWRRLPAGYLVFIISVFFTALGSGYYHLSPNDQTLVWDRLPIAIACAGLMAGAWQDFSPQRRQWPLLLALSLFGTASVFYWQVSADLRPYLALQVLPLLLIPIWQLRADRADRIAVSAAIGLYVLAKIAEITDHQIYAQLSLLSGHTLKHLLASLAAGLIIYQVSLRVKV